MQKLRGRSVLVHRRQRRQGSTQVQKEDHGNRTINELRDREFYTKPTTARKLKASAAKNRWKKKLASQELPKKLY
jgi:ribosomal protein S21